MILLLFFQKIKERKKNQFNSIYANRVLGQAAAKPCCFFLLSSRAGCGDINNVHRFPPWPVTRQVYHSC
jgi:hypothetical protein